MILNFEIIITGRNIRYCSSVPRPAFVISMRYEHYILRKIYSNIRVFKLFEAVTHSAEDCGEGSIIFQIYNEHTGTLTKEYDSNNSPGNHIRHPALRYVQRLLACTVFSRQEEGKAQKDELFMLDPMLHAQPIDTRIKDNEDVLPLAKTMSLRKARPLARVSIPHEPPYPPHTSEARPSTLIETKLNYLLTSVGDIKIEKKEIKEQLTSMSMFLGILSNWIQSGGFSNPPCFSP
ncbi:LETM1 domain-containing protein LETM2 mitochondrial [Bienertia sinuspersici]